MTTLHGNDTTRHDTLCQGVENARRSLVLIVFFISLTSLEDKIMSSFHEVILSFLRKYIISYKNAVGGFNNK